MPDRPGGLADLLALLDHAQVSVEYLYAQLADADGRALLVLKLTPADQAAKVLAQAGIA